MSQLDPLDLREQERERDEARKRNEHLLRLEADDLKWLLKDKRGRRFMWRLLDKAGVFRSSFTGNSETFFREGQRNMGLMLLAQINEHAPEMYAVMLQESKK